MANYLGFTAALTLLTSIVAGVIWLVVYALFRKPFISSFFMIFILAAGTILCYSSKPLAVTGALITSAVIYFNHKKNIVEWLISKNSA